MQNNFYFLYYFFDNILIRWIRVLLFFLVGIIVYLKLHDGGFVIRILPLYFVLILQELFIHFKLENGSPAKTVSDDVVHPIESVEFKVRAHLERHTEMEKVIHELLHEESVVYFNKLINLSYKPQDLKILEDDVLKKASDLVKAMKGKYIHTLDIYVAYLLLVDEQNKMLFKADITSDDVVYLLAWVRKKSMTDGKKHKELRFTGSGVFDFFIYGWSAQLAKYASNFTRYSQVIYSVTNLSLHGSSWDYFVVFRTFSNSRLLLYLKEIHLQFLEGFRLLLCIAWKNKIALLFQI